VWFLLVLLLIAGFGIAYSISPAARARRKADAAVNRLQVLLRGVDDAHRQATDQETKTAQAFAADVRNLRLKAIKVEELKRHASGLRLSALRNAGIDDFSQMQGWSAQRLMQVKGIGPDSAHRIASLVDSISRQSNQQPIPHPVEGPMTSAGYKVLEAIHLDIQTQTTFREPKAQLQGVIKDFRARQARVRSKTGFFTWFPGFGAKPGLQEAVAETAAMEADLQHSHPASGLYQGLSHDLERLAGLRRNGVDLSVVDQDLKAHPDWYQTALNALLGERPAMLQLAQGLGRYLQAAPSYPSSDSSSATHTVTIDGLPIQISIRMGMSTGSGGPATFEPRERPSTQDVSAFWVGPGKDITVADHLIRGGMVYVGTGLASIQGYSIEPALIDPKKQVQTEEADFRARQTNYWPSYETISPEGRGSYLKWLVAGKSDPQADIGFVFLYFYGLERRVLHDLANHTEADPEVAAILGEIRRLLGIYGGNGSFHTYATSLLDYRAAKQFAGAPQIPATVPLVTNPYGSNLDLKVGLAAHAVQKLPLPAAWAVAWLHADPTMRPKTTAKRCPKEFEALFALEYRKRFGDGLKIPENKTRLKIQHRTASPSFGHGMLEVSLDLPDVTVLSGPISKLQETAEACYPQLNTYSRFMGRNPDKAGTLEALLLLPPALWPDLVRSEMVDLQQKVDASTGPLVVPFMDIQLRLPEGGDLNKAKFGALSRALGALGLGIEPDPRFGGSLPEMNDAIALFKAEGLDQDRPVSKGFVFGALAVHLAAVVAHVDGEFGAEEEILLTGHMAQWLHLNDQERLRLAARLDLMRKTKPVQTGLQKRIDALTTDQKSALADLLVLVVHADGVVSPGEVKVLEKVFGMLGQKDGAIYSKLHGAAAEPITVRQAGPEESGFKLPPKPLESAPVGMTLDMAKVAALRAESAKVSDLLGSIFKEEEHLPAPVPDPDAQELLEEPSLLGLDPDHAGLLQTLLARPQWSRAELDDICSERGMMVDGALERINEAALDAFDEPLIEGDDPLEVYRDRLLDKTA
jgi:tellurite resistance protein